MVQHADLNALGCPSVPSIQVQSLLYFSSEVPTFTAKNWQWVKRPMHISYLNSQLLMADNYQLRFSRAQGTMCRHDNCGISKPGIGWKTPDKASWYCRMECILTVLQCICQKNLNVQRELIHYYSPSYVSITIQTSVEVIHRGYLLRLCLTNLNN